MAKVGWEEMVAARTLFASRSLKLTALRWTDFALQLEWERYADHSLIGSTCAGTVVPGPTGCFGPPPKPL